MKLTSSLNEPEKSIKRKLFRRLIVFTFLNEFVHFLFIFILLTCMWFHRIPFISFGLVLYSIFTELKQYIGVLRSKIFGLLLYFYCFFFSFVVRKSFWVYKLEDNGFFSGNNYSELLSRNKKSRQYNTDRICSNNSAMCNHITIFFLWKDSWIEYTKTVYYAVMWSSLTE